MIACADSSGTVEVNPAYLASILGCEPKEITEALIFLQRPDDNSRTSAEDGRRILKEGQFLYRLVNFQKYQEIRNREDRREYLRAKQARYRAKKKAAARIDTRGDSIDTVNNVSHTERETETETLPKGSISPLDAISTGTREPGPKGERERVFEGSESQEDFAPKENIRRALVRMFPAGGETLTAAQADHFRRNMPILEALSQEDWGSIETFLIEGNPKFKPSRTNFLKDPGKTLERSNNHKERQNYHGNDNGSTYQASGELNRKRSAARRGKNGTNFKIPKEME